ncbi:DUF475 domain-containing protein [Kitasatospora sp. NPDC096147]|uniref:DUF475 domain-containing protein n=1 Tax=Kitasatospora sp. NPDC096147 TaxID=3364093 RepID=UPI00382D5806
MVLRTFGWSFGITAAGLVAAGLLWGWEGFGIVLILSILEISLSFDNAVVNATVLKRMNPYWQKIFLTVGILIAVFGMRLVFPLLVVGLTAHLGPMTVIDLALNEGKTYEGHTYGQYLEMANPAIAAFGGIFLLMIFLDFILGEKDFNWLGWLERPLEKVGKLDAFSSLIALVTIALAANLFAGDNAETVLLAGILGLATYLAVNGLSSVFESRLEDDAEAEEEAEKSGKSIVQVGGRAAFFLFLYLEVLDASFSFDGVVGAFAITQNIFMIMLGLGIGAMYIRSLTVYLVRKGTLDDYVYLEHGAHYAIGVLAVILLVGIEYHIPEIVTGLIGVAFIAAAFASSVYRNKKEAELEGSTA